MPRPSGTIPPEKGTPCEICGATNRKLVWDHDHATGEFRGWLCGNCNSGIGLLGDSIEDLYNAVNYMAKVRWGHGIVFGRDDA